jgi:hypothetical protein
LTLTSAPFPDVATIGVDRATCPAYASDRRPELVAANAYFAAIEDGGDGDEGWNDSTAALFLTLSFVAGGAAVVLALLVLRRWDVSSFSQPLLSSSGAPQKAKNSF